MPRPRLRRRVRFMPEVTYFKPAGVRLAELGETIVTVDEWEALRLKDFLGLEQKEAANKMKLSQPTFNRLLRSAREKVATALIRGKAIKIEGGTYKMVQPRGRGLGPGLGAGRGAGGGAGAGRGVGRGAGGGGRMGGSLAAGPIGECVCPKCGQRAAHQRGIPCYQQKCPKCGSLMTRE